MRMNKVLADNLQAWGSLTLPARLAAVAALSGVVSAPQVESALKLTEMNHKIIRDGWTPPFTAKEELWHAMQMVAALLSGPSFKFPNYYAETPTIAISEPPAEAVDRAGSSSPAERIEN